jgi:molecular chaperone GrpE (heat shock protein)
MTPGVTSAMRNRTRAQERADEIDISPAKLLAEIESLKAEREAVRTQADEYLDLLQRERAEFANYRRRTAEERERELGQRVVLHTGVRWRPCYGSWPRS